VGQNTNLAHGKKISTVRQRAG